MEETLTVQILNKGSKWQVYQLMLVISSHLCTGLQMLVIVFIGFEPNFGCKNNTETAWNNSRLVVSFDNQCNVYNTTTNSSTTCAFQYDIHKHESIVSDWDLICTKAYLSETSQMLYIAGMCVVSFFLTPIPDRFGRRPCFLALSVLYILCSFGLAASPNIYCFIALRFFSGLVGMGLSLVRFVYVMELSPTHLRPFLSMVTGIGWGTSLCLAALVAHLMRGKSWRLVQAVGSIPTLAAFLYIIFLKESPLWLSTNGKTTEVQKLLSEITKSTSEDFSKETIEESVGKDKLLMEETSDPSEDPSNISGKSSEDPSNISGKSSEDPSNISGKSSEDPSNISGKSSENPSNISGKSSEDPSNISGKSSEDPSNISGKSSEDPSNIFGKSSEDPSNISGKSSDDPSVPNNKPVSILDIMRNRTTRLLTLVVCYTWFVNSLVYYGIFFMSSALSGDRILNFFLSALVEIPANIFLYFCLKYFGRRKPLIGLHGFCAVSLLMGGIFVITLQHQTKNIIMRIVTVLGKFGITATFCLIFIYTTELYPTNFRASGLGLGSASARIGALMSPFSTVLARKLPWGPGIIFGGLCLVITIIMFWTPETRDINLPQNIEEVENRTKFGKKKEDSKRV